MKIENKEIARLYAKFEVLRAHEGLLDDFDDLKEYKNLINRLSVIERKASYNHHDIHSILNEFDEAIINISNFLIKLYNTNDSVVVLKNKYDTCYNDGVYPCIEEIRNDKILAEEFVQKLRSICDEIFRALYIDRLSSRLTDDTLLEIWKLRQLSGHLKQPNKRVKEVFIHLCEQADEEFNNSIDAFALYVLNMIVDAEYNYHSYSDSVCRAKDHQKKGNFAEAIQISDSCERHYGDDLLKIKRDCLHIQEEIGNTNDFKSFMDIELRLYSRIEGSEIDLILNEKKHKLKKSRAKKFVLYATLICILLSVPILFINYKLASENDLATYRESFEDTIVAKIGSEANHTEVSGLGRVELTDVDYTLVRRGSFLASHNATLTYKILVFNDNIRQVVNPFYSFNDKKIVAQDEPVARISVTVPFEYKYGKWRPGKIEAKARQIVLEDFLVLLRKYAPELAEARKLAKTIERDINNHNELMEVSATLHAFKVYAGSSDGK